MSGQASSKPNLPPLAMPSSSSSREIDSCSIASSPEFLPSSAISSTRRESTAESSFMDMTPLSRLMSEQSSLSEGTSAKFNEADRQLEQLVQNEPIPQAVSADELPTAVPANADKGRFAFSCAFGWTGDLEDLGDLPTTKAAFLEKLLQGVDGITLVQHALVNYQTEINSRKYHRFSTDFLLHQNRAIVITLSQMDEIELHMNEVVEEVNKVAENDAEIKKELIEAFQHARPWIQRTRRIVYDAHVFYKINYVLGANVTAQKAHKR